MSTHDVSYFETLLDECRSECLKYELPRKDEIFEILTTHADTYRERDEAEQRRKTLHKKKASKEELEAATAVFKPLKDKAKQLQDVSMKALVPIIESDVHLDQEPESFQTSLMECSIITQQGPKAMADFCQEHGNEIADDLLANEEIMKEMLLNGGAKNGKFLEAYKLYDEFIQIMEEDESLLSDCHRRLAMGTALQLASPRSLFGIPDGKVDPKKRFLHYVHAHLNGELDPSFPYFTTWEYRHIIDCDATDEELQWGRDQLKRYYPSHLSCEKSTFTYCAQVQTDVSYQKPQWEEGELKNYRMIISGGGKCGPRAWFGRFLCKAFGVPTWGVKQPGHAALARWTPDIGWETCFGGSLARSWWENRSGEDFKHEAHARLALQDPDRYFAKIALLQCMAQVYQEKSISRDHTMLTPTSMWNSLARVQMRHWFKKYKGKKNRHCLEPKDGEEPEDCDIRSFLLRTDDPASDNQVEVVSDHVRIPACAVASSKRVSLVRCFEGGGQIQFEKGPPGLVEYRLPSTVPQKQYELFLKICTLHREQESDIFCVRVNGSKVCEVPIVYSAGDWAYTDPVRIKIGGDDDLAFTRKMRKGEFWGLALREIALKPAS